MQVFIGPVLEEGRLKSIKNYISSYSPAHGEFKNLCFVSVAPMVCVSRAFVYDVVNANKIVVISSTKLPSYPHVQVTTGLTHGEHFKPNLNVVD